MIFRVRPLTLHQPRRLLCVAALLAGAAWFASAPASAGDASSAFRVTIEFTPESAGACSASTELGAPQLTCRPTVIGSGPTPGGGSDRTGGRVAWLRADTPLRVAGEMVEVGVENHYAWLEPNAVAWSERSSRLVVVGGHEYVETTFSW